MFGGPRFEDVPINQPFDQGKTGGGGSVVGVGTKRLQVAFSIACGGCLKEFCKDPE